VAQADLLRVLERIGQVGPTTSESTPWSLLTSARERMVRSAPSLCDSVRCPRRENMTLKFRSAASDPYSCSERS
jgi:hypothetical protein